MSKVCMCCGRNDIISPPKEETYYEVNAFIPKSNYWCIHCWCYTELVDRKEFDKGYNLVTNLKEHVKATISICRTQGEVAKKLGISTRTVSRTLKEYNLKLRSRYADIAKQNQM